MKFHTIKHAGGTLVLELSCIRILEISDATDLDSTRITIGTVGTRFSDYCLNFKNKADRDEVFEKLCSDLNRLNETTNS